MEMNLIKEGETYPGPTLPFEHVDWEEFVQGVSASYLGTRDEGFVVIDLAEYTTTEAAAEIYEQIWNIEFMRPGEDGTVVFETVDNADAAKGVVYPPSAGEEFTATGVILRSGRVVAVITVLSHEEDGRQQQAGALAEELIRGLTQ
jgi:hypothetical protein